MNGNYIDKSIPKQNAFVVWWKNVFVVWWKTEHRLSVSFHFRGIWYPDEVRIHNPTFKTNGEAVVTVSAIFLLFVLGSILIHNAQQYGKHQWIKNTPPTSCCGSSPLPYLSQSFSSPVDSGIGSTPQKLSPKSSESNSP